MTITIQAAINSILAATPFDPAHDTVDTIKAGDPHQPLRGIATSFMATCEVIERAATAGANLLIAHEPAFYNHLDATDWLERDPVYQAKRALIERHSMVVWRFHDYWHMYQPDGIYTGVLRALGWQPAAQAGAPIYDIPLTSLAELAAQLKQKLGISMLRAVGDPAQPCRRVGLLVGAIGGRAQIGLMSEHAVDALVCGEIAEWEISEYVRDAVRLGMARGLIVTGHAPSEEAGMAYLAEWLRERLPGVPATHVPAESPFWFA